VLYKTEIRPWYVHVSEQSRVLEIACIRNTEGLTIRHKVRIE